MAEKITNEQIIEALKGMTIVELNELVKAVEEAFGVTAAVATAAAAPAEEEGPVNAGPSEVSLILKGLGTGGKVAVIKGLKDYIVVDTDDVLMICPRNDEQNIKKYIDDVKFNKGDKYI